MQKVYLKSGSYIARRAAKNLKADQVAIVIWNTIFIYGTTEENFLANKQWLRHELEHVKQWKKYGFFGYIWKYLRYSIKYGYEENPFEKEAVAQENDLEGIDDFDIIKDEDRKPMLASIKSSTSNLHSSLVWIFALIFGYLAIAKALRIPVTYDESGQILYYAKRSVYDIFMFTNPWPTNHILNSLLIKLFTSIFGDHLIVERLPNLLAYCLFYYYTYRWSTLLFAKKTFGLVFTVAILLLINFSFDFYSLARGYGLALSFQLASMYHLYRYINNQDLKSFWNTQLFLLLMFLSNFSWLSLWLSIEIIIGLNMLVLKKYKRLPLLALSTLVHMAFIYNPAKRMSETGQFIYWKSNGFFQDTFRSLTGLYFYEDKFIHFTPDLIFAVVCIFSVTILVYTYLFRNKSKLWLFPSLFFGAMLVTIIQNIILETPFLNGRTALLFYPLIGFLFISILKIIWDNPISRKIFGIAIIVFCLLNFSLNYAKDYVLEWKFDRNTYRVLDALEKDNPQKLPKRFGVYWLFNPSMKYHIQERKLDWLELEEFRDRLPNDSLDYYYGISGEEPVLDSMSFKQMEDYSSEKLFGNPNPVLGE